MKPLTIKGDLQDWECFDKSSWKSRETRLKDAKVTPLAVAASNIGQGLGWLGFWIMLGMITTIKYTTGT